MALKEKTVELNLTSEVIQFLHAVSGRPVAAWGPTPHQEARLGFDAKVQAGGFKLLIQYKSVYRFHQGNNEWRFKINGTTRPDQHKRLCAHANAGIPTFYAFPLFGRYKVIRKNMQTLNLLRLPLVCWLDPRRMKVPNNGVGQHQLGVLAVKPWTAKVYSEPSEFDYDGEDFIRVLTQIGRQARVIAALDAARGDGGEPPDPPYDDDGGDGDGDDQGGTGLVGFQIG